MENVIKRVAILMLVCMMHALVCHADWFKGKVVNAETGEILIGASIQSEVNPQPGWSMQNSATADSTGCFLIGSSWEGRILFTVSMIGYKNFRKVDYSYGSNVTDTIDLGTIKLQPTALMLQEMVVSAKIPRITMSGDTVVFNPEAFKLKEGARLDELIKKLPGVQHKDGQYYWNGKPLRLMMNGKNIFGGDQVVELLPAEVAQKLKVYNRKSELARHTGKDDGEEDHVLDIQVKPGFLDKWYGELSGLYQTKKNYMGELLANRLSDHDPQMVYGQANNINRKIDRTMNSSMNANIDGFGQSQYGSYNYQHNWQSKGTSKFSNNRWDLSANMGHADGWSPRSQLTETFFPDQDRTLSLTKNYRRNHSLKPQLSANLFAYADSVNTITAGFTTSYEKTHSLNKNENASYGYAPNEFQYHTLAAAMGAKPGDALYDHLINRGRNYQTDDGELLRLNVYYGWQRFMGKKGSFSLNGNTTIDGQTSDSHITRQLEYLREGRNENQWQRYNYDRNEVTTSLRAALDYWLTQKVYLNVSDNLSFNRRHSSRDIYADTNEALVKGGNATTLDAANGMNALLRTCANTLTLKSTINATKQLMIMPKVDWTYRHESADYHYGALDTTTVRNSHALTPSVFLKWKMSRVRNMDLQFAYTTTVPDIWETFDYRNTIDPLSIATGNPHLGNTHSHTTTFGYHRMWLRKQIVLGLSGAYTKNINPLSGLYSYNSQTGVYTSKPMNVKGGDQWRLGVDYDQGLGVDFRLMNKFSVTTSQSYGYLTLVDDGTMSALPALNHQKQLGMTNDMQFSYEVSKLQLTLYDWLDWSRYRYDASGYNNSPLQNRVGLRATIKLGAVSMWANLSDIYCSGYQMKALNGHRIYANANVTYTFNKQKCFLTLAAYDIFNQDKGYYSSNTAFQRSETESDYLHHYAYLKFTYRFDAKAKKNKK